MPPTVWIPPHCFALLSLGLGDIDGFFEWCDKAIDNRDHITVPIRTYPFLDPIRNDPRYLGLLRRMKPDA